MFIIASAFEKKINAFLFLRGTKGSLPYTKEGMHKATYTNSSKGCLEQPLLTKKKEVIYKYIRELSKNRINYKKSGTPQASRRLLVIIIRLVIQHNGSSSFASR